MNRRMIARRFALATMAITAASLAQCYDNLSSPIDWLTYDARAKLRAALPEPDDLATNLAAVFFDDVAVEKVNDGSFSVAYAPATNAESARALYPRVWPWPRFIHGQIVRELKAQGAAAIGFDVLFSEQSEPRRDETTIDPVHGPLSSDQFFAVKMREAGNVFLGVQEGDMLPARVFATNAAGLGSIQSRSDYAVLRRARPFDEVREWNPILQRYVKALDLNLRHGEVDGMMLRIPIRSGKPSRTNIFEVPLNTNGTLKLTRKGDLDVKDDPQDEGSQSEAPFVTRRVWTLGLQLAAKALGIELSQAEVSEEEIILPADSSGRKRRIPLDQDGMMLIDWLIRYPDVRNGRTPILDGSLGGLLFNDKMRSQGESAKLAAQFTNRVVIIGSVASGNNMSDLGATPLEAQAPLVTKHLNVANSVMTGRFVRTSSLLTECVLIMGLGLLSAFLTWRLRVLVAAIGIFGLCLAYIAFSTGMYINYRYWIPMVMPVFGGLILPHFSLVTYRVMFEQKEQRRVRGIFSKIVSPDVVQELLSVEKLALGGVRRNITVFFADIRGFTEFTDSTQQLAEEYIARSNLGEVEARAYFDRIAAEQLSTVNLYLATIADTIKAHLGTLDKYMGDCVMAFWGAPVRNEKHALCCVRAAIDCQRALYRLNQDRFAENENRKKDNAVRADAGQPPLPLLPLLSLGTGINTGYATIGLMGSDATILNYTVFGREVNLASRLEGASGRGRILISEATFFDLKRDDPALAELCVAQAPITPKGFRQPVRIYDVPWKPPGEG